MKAIRVVEFGGPEVLRLEEVPDPVAGAGQVVIAVKAVGVNPVDCYIRSGKYGKNRPLPYTPGTDAAGIVESVGAGVTAFQPGDRVYTAQTATGAYAEKTLAVADHIFPLPSNVSFEAGAGVNVPYGTAYRALVIRGAARASETLLVHGASGGVGLATVQIAAALGLVVFGTASTDEGRMAVRNAGARDVFDHKSVGYLDSAKAATLGGKGFDIIIEMVANLNLGNDLTVLADRGRVVVVGSRGPVTIDARDTMSRDAAVLGMSLANANPIEVKTIHAAIYAGLANGTLKPVIGKRFPLGEAAQAHREIIDESGHAPGKLILIP